MLSHFNEEAEEKSSCQWYLNIQYLMNKFFYYVGYRVAKSPSFFIIVPIFLTLLGFTGFQQLNYETDPEYLFAPSNGRGRVERKTIKELFPVNDTYSFAPSRVTEISPFSRIFVLAKDEGTMLRTVIWDELIELDYAIRNLTIKYKDHYFRYDDICAIKDNDCLGNMIFNLNDYMPQIENGSMFINYPIMLYPVVIPHFFGGAVVNESEGVLISTKALSIGYWFRSSTNDEKQKSLKFEERLMDYLNTVKFDHIRTVHYASSSLEIELDKTAEAVFPFLIVTFGFMITFSLLSVSLSDWVRSKLVIGIVGIISAAMGTVCAFGFMMYIGVDFIGLNMAAPFLLLGIGIDDMFVLLAAWHRTPIQEPVPMRLAKTYSEAAVSITITSLTNTLSFLVGCFTPFPSVQIFCLYTGMAIFVIYLWCITFFGGVLAISGYQERRQKHILTQCKIISKSEAEKEGRNFLYRWLCTGGINSKDPYNPIDNEPHFVSVFFRDVVGTFLNKPWAKVGVLVTFFIYISGAIVGIMNLKEGLQRDRLVLDYSYLGDYFRAEDKLFRDFQYSVQVAIHDQNLRFSDRDQYKDVMRLHKQYEGLPSIGSRIYTQSWMRGFYRYLQRRPKLRENITDERSFIEVLRRDYLKESSNEINDVIFNEDYTRIIASRFIVQGYNMSNLEEEKQMTLDVRRLADESPFNVTVYNPFFVFIDQFLLVRETSIQAIASAAVLMMIVAIIMIPNVFCAFWVGFSIASIEIGVIGYMAHWNVNLDSISMINLIMCIGFSVDFSAHITYAYLTADVATIKDRVKDCLFALGLPILQGAVSTIIGILILVVAPSYIFLVFFKTVLLVIIFGFLHGIFLLPVLLSLFGPGSCSKLEEVTNPPPIVYSSNFGPSANFHEDGTPKINQIKPIKTAEKIIYEEEFHRSFQRRFSQNSIHSRRDSVAPRSVRNSIASGLNITLGPSNTSDTELDSQSTASPHYDINKRSSFLSSPETVSISPSPLIQDMTSKLTPKLSTHVKTSELDKSVLQQEFDRSFARRFSSNSIRRGSMSVGRTVSLTPETIATANSGYSSDENEFSSAGPSSYDPDFPGKPDAVRKSAMLNSLKRNSIAISGLRKASLFPSKLSRTRNTSVTEPSRKESPKKMNVQRTASSGNPAPRVSTLENSKKFSLSSESDVFDPSFEHRVDRTIGKVNEAYDSLDEGSVAKL